MLVERARRHATTDTSWNGSPTAGRLFFARLRGAQSPAVATGTVRGPCHNRFMRVTAEQIANVPAENIRVSRESFGRIWSYADDLGVRRDTDPYAIGVLFTCEWIATQAVWSRVSKRWELPVSPVTERHYKAMPETIEDEYLAAVRASVPGKTGRRAELARGAAAMLELAWAGSRRPPLDLPATLPH